MKRVFSAFVVRRSLVATTAFLIILSLRGNPYNHSRFTHIYVAD
jgi:hypothetical protein